MSDEISLWKGTPSQWINLKHFAITGLVAVGILVTAFLIGNWWLPALVLCPAAYAAWRFFAVRCQSYELTTQRLRIRDGVINQHIDEIELYRVKDTLMIRTWWMRLTGLSTISLKTSDRSLPQLDIPAIHDGIELREQLRKQVELQRDSKRVREMDFDESGASSEELEGDLPS